MSTVNLALERTASDAKSRWPAWVRRWWGRRHLFGDWLWAGTVFGFAAFGQLVSPIGLLTPYTQDMFMGPVPHWTVWAQLLVFLLGIPAIVAVTVLFRRTYPWLVLGLSVALLVLFGNPLPAAFGIYSYAAWFPRRDRLTAWSATIVLVWLVAAGIPDSIASVIINILALFTLIGVPLGFGLWIGTRRDLIRSLRERTERLEREQHLLAASVAAEERTRIAREMHDVVAHRVSLMVLHAGGLEVSAPDERTAGIAETIRGTGREALTELRDILGVLRAEGDQIETAPQPGLADIARLVHDWHTAGMRVQLVHERAGDQSAAVERTAYRVVQEGLTNCAKHAPAADVEVRIEVSANALLVTVTNGPSPRIDPLPAPESGYGLSGLAERVSIAGGTLTWGDTFGDRWTLAAELPTTTT